MVVLLQSSSLAQQLVQLHIVVESVVPASLYQALHLDLEYLWQNAFKQKLAALFHALVQRDRARTQAQNRREPVVLHDLVKVGEELQDARITIVVLQVHAQPFLEEEGDVRDVRVL